MKTILVTGGGGYIGSCASNPLSTQDKVVAALVKNFNSVKSLTKWYNNKSNGYKK